jgi:hypothetical protein
MNTDKFHELQQFLGGYFHQDFLLDYSDPDAAIAAFLAEAPQEVIQAACNELDEVIPVIEELQDPEKFLNDALWCSYYPPADGLTVADWLRHVRQKLRTSALPTSSETRPAQL